MTLSHVEYSNLRIRHYIDIGMGIPLLVHLKQWKCEILPSNCQVSWFESSEYVCQWWQVLVDVKM